MARLLKTRENTARNFLLGFIRGSSLGSRLRKMNICRLGGFRVDALPMLTYRELRIKSRLC